MGKPMRGGPEFHMLMGAIVCGLLIYAIVSPPIPPFDPASDDWEKP